MTKQNEKGAQANQNQPATEAEIQAAEKRMEKVLVDEGVSPDLAHEASDEVAHNAGGRSRKDLAEAEREAPAAGEEIAALEQIGELVGAGRDSDD